MDEKIIEIKEKARKILEDIQIDTSIGESRIITMLQKIEQQDIEKSEIDIIEKTLNNIENYLFTKQKMQVEINDYEYLKNRSIILDVKIILKTFFIVARFKGVK